MISSCKDRRRAPSACVPSPGAARVPPGTTKGARRGLLIEGSPGFSGWARGHRPSGAGGPARGAARTQAEAAWGLGKPGKAQKRVSGASERHAACRHPDCGRWGPGDIARSCGFTWSRVTAREGPGLGSRPAPTAPANAPRIVAPARNRVVSRLHHSIIPVAGALLNAQQGPTSLGPIRASPAPRPHGPPPGASHLTRRSRKKEHGRSQGRL